MTVPSTAGLGDPNACERAASDCERAARLLDTPIRRLTSLRGVATSAWRGTAGESLVSAVDSRRHSLVQAQGELQAAAGRLRTAAAQVREVIRRAEERARQNQRIVKPSAPPVDLRV